jgi:hypothetical protein
MVPIIIRPFVDVCDEVGGHTEVVMELPQRHKNPFLVLLYPHAPALSVHSAQVWLVKIGDVSLQISSMKKVSLLRSNAEGL